MEATRLRLLTEQPFYAMFLNKCVVGWNEKVGTAGIRITKRGDLEMAVCRTYFDTLTVQQQVGLLIHEMLHFMHRHLGGVRCEGLDQEVANWAMDVANNQMIDPHLLHPTWLVPKTFGLTADKHKDQAFEYYYPLLLKDKEKYAGKGLKSQDNHGYFKDESNGAHDVAKIIRDAVQAAKSETERQFEPGKVPAFIDGLLDELDRASKIDWKNELRKFIGRNLSDHTESTRTRANRRLGLEAMGVKREYIPKVLIMCDHSGSVSDEQAVECLTEVKGILRTIGSEKTEVVFFDAEIGAKYQLSAFNQVPLKREQCGGTSFDVAYEYAREVRPDLLIMLTDGECGQPEDKLKFPTVWCVVGDCVADHLEGTVLKL